MALTDTRARALHGQAQKDGKAGKESDGGGLNGREILASLLSFYRKTLSLGVYPDVSLKMARQARDRTRVLLAQGIAPGEQRKADKAEAVRMETEQAKTFRVVAMEYYRRKLSEKKELYRKQTLARLENQIFPSIGHIPISQLRPSDILAGLRKVEERGSIDMAHRLAALVCQVCRYAVASGYAEFNAAAVLLF